MKSRAPSQQICGFACAVLAAGAAFGDPVIAPSVAEISPVAVGDPAPRFTAYNVDGSEFRFEPGSLERPTLIVFYRGGWCGSCNQQLRDIATVYTDIRAMGVDVVFLNGDRPEILYSSLRPETKAAIDGLDFVLLSDSGLNAAAAFGIAYVLDDDVLVRYRSRAHWDLTQSSIDRFDALPLPSIFLVATDGVIAFRYYDPDPRVRLPAADLKAIVANVVGTRE